MLKIRLARHGRKGRPFYRVVVQDSRRSRDGRFVESLGFYDPLNEPATFDIDAERAAHWLSHGAQPTETVHRFLAAEGLIEPWQPKPRSKRADAKRAAAAEAAAAAAAAESSE